MSLFRNAILALAAVVAATGAHAQIAFRAAAQAGQAAGPPNFTPTGDARIIAATKIIGGGEETAVTFDVAGLDVGGDYTYFCSFPGHFVLMFGKFIVE